MTDQPTSTTPSGAATTSLGKARPASPPAPDAARPAPVDLTPPTAVVRGFGRIPVTGVQPVVEGGVYPAKAVVGELVPIRATVFREGHDAVNASVILTSPGGAERRVDRPWHAIEPYDAPLPVPERFEVYPNRDSTAFVGQYGFDPDWKLRDFVRGTIRLKGWAEAWAPVFTEVEGLSGPEGDARLREMADEFWSRHAYAEGDNALVGPTR